MGVEAVTSSTGVTDPAAAAGAAAAGAAATGGGTSAAAGAAGAVAWTDSIQDVEIRDFAVNKGYNKESLDKIAPTIISQYRNLEKLVGAEKAGRTVEVPDFEKGDEASLNAFYDRLGRPKDTKDYDLALPDKGVDPKFDAWARSAFHKAGLTGKQANTIGKLWMDYGTQAHAEMVAADTLRFQGEDNALKTKWGAAYDNKMSLASAAAKQMGVPGEALDALQKVAGYGAVMETFANIASKLGEGNFITGEGAGAGGVMTPAEADAELKKLQGDKEWMAAWMDKSNPKHKEAVARKTQLTALLAGVKAAV